MQGSEKTRERRKKTFDPESVEWETKICLESFGVKIGVRSNDSSLSKIFEELLPDILPNGWSNVTEREIGHWFSIYRQTSKAKRVSFYKNDELLSDQKAEPDNFDFLVSSLRLTIAEYAPRHVFLHSGVVAYKDRAIVIPGKSFTGKTTLVAELIKKGCRYYSDEYAVIDREGLVEPYPKKLSLRGIIDDYRQVDVPAAELGGETGAKKIPVGLILVSEYKKKARFKLESVTAGEGVIALIANSVSIRRDPQFVLDVLTPIAGGARVLKTKRGSAERFAGRLLQFLDDEKIL